MKVYETMCDRVQGIWMDIPPIQSPAVHQLTLDQIHQAASKLSVITGKSITADSLRNSIQFTNECKKYS